MSSVKCERCDGDGRDPESHADPEFGTVRACDWCNGAGFPSEPKNAYLFPNGMVAVFDAEGQQVPQYQGRLIDVMEKLTRDFPNVVVHSQ